MSVSQKLIVGHFVVEASHLVSLQNAPHADVFFVQRQPVCGHI